MTKKVKTTSLPDGFTERDATWHLRKFIQFTKFKMQIREPSPHLAIVGHMSKNSSLERKLWLLGCYAATYCLPTAQVIWELKTHEEVKNDPKNFEAWLKDNWKGIITRTERRCVRTPKKMSECLVSYANWMTKEYPKLTNPRLKERDPKEYYDIVWESVGGIRYFGRYINIRLVEGLRRYCDIPARLYDIRSIGGWSPKKALCYLFPEHAGTLLIDDSKGNALTNKLTYRLLRTIREKLPKVDCYVLAAMLCEYKGCFEKKHQYPVWTIDQEPLMYDKVFDYWGKVVDKNVLWEARKALFPELVLGEIGDRWYGTRWSCAETLRTFGYNWSDLVYDYVKTKESGDWANPVRRER